MSLTNISEKKRITRLFAGFYALSAVLVIMILTVFWSNETFTANQGNKKYVHLSGKQLLSQTDNFLNDYVETLQDLDKKYAALMIDSGIKANFDPPATRILQTEQSLRSAIDSIDKVTSYGKNKIVLVQLLSSYKDILENRRTIDDMQRAVLNMSKQLNGDQKNLSRLQSDASMKDSTIAALENRIRLRRSEVFPSSSTKSAYILLEKENDYLKSEIERLKKKSVINLQVGESDKSPSHTSAEHSP
ncbi:MAG TPA: hypothetical protein VMH01_08880 [Puia sp.]|nr:hypothetical protein [Puia sp.]